MTPTILRRILRWTHLITAAIIGTFLYSPWSANAIFAAATLWVVFPLMVMTGVAMWQQVRLMRLFK
jgi:thiosulfate reductase cytochrome b subunit